MYHSRCASVWQSTCYAGAMYVKLEISKGNLPSIFAALIVARAATHAAFKMVPADYVTSIQAI